MTRWALSAISDVQIPNLSVESALARRFLIIFAGLYLLFVPCLGWTRDADNPQSQCPADAEQKLFTFTLLVKNGQIKDGAKIFGFANETMRLCPDRPVALGQAAELYMIVGQAIQDPDNQLTIYSAAYQAILANDWAAMKSYKSPRVKLPDGTEMTLYNYGNASKFLELIIPQFLRLRRLDRIHPIVDPSWSEPTFKSWPANYWEEDQCPYPNDRSTRSVDEAQAFLSLSDDMGNKTIVRDRVHYLWESCEGQKNQLSNLLFTFHNDWSQQLQKEKKWPEALDQLNEAFLFVDTYINTSGFETWGLKERKKMYKRKRQFERNIEYYKDTAAQQ